MRIGQPALSLFLLSGCMAELPPDTTPLTMPPADGRDAPVSVDPHHYIVNRRALNEGIALRITRKDWRDFDYSEGLEAKRVAEAYCAGFDRLLDPNAIGRFSVPNAWIFDGDCR